MPLGKDHSGLATCLYFLLSGVDPLANAKDWTEVRSIRRELSEGRYKIVPEAQALREVIFGGWTGGTARRTFRETREMVEGIIGASDDAELHSPAPKDYRAMEAVCVQWLDTATLDSCWLTEQQYRAKWQSLGYDIEDGRWGDGPLITTEPTTSLFNRPVSPSVAPSI